MEKLIFLRRIVVIVAAFLFGVAEAQATVKQKSLPQILVIGIDGLGAHGIELAKTPVLDEMMNKGAYSLAARTVVPSSSGPAWTSIITGATVERHGVGNNSWTVESKTLEPVIKGDHNMFPTIFGEIRKNDPEAVIGAVYHWGTLVNFIEKDVCDLSISAESEDIATQKACDFLASKNPNFTFVHLDLVDHGGHHGGYRSDEYVKSVEKADSLVGVFVDKLTETKQIEKMIILIVADHGGLEKKHGGSSPDEMIIPFIIYGKGVKKGYEIKHPVFNYDLAPTVAWLFGFQLNDWISGKPLIDAFSK